MRLAVVLNLVAVVLLCPFICGAAEGDQPAHRPRPGNCHADDPSAPIHCPDEGTSCLCQGAIRSAEVRSDTDGVALTAHIAWQRDLPAQLLHLASPSRAWPDRPDTLALSPRALLQNFRC
jgi:hypothetical protein